MKKILLFPLFIILTAAVSTAHAGTDMYCITNNVPIYKDLPSAADTNTPAVLAVPGDTNVKGYIDQLMKYDRVSVMENNGGWAHIVETHSSASPSGWVAANTLAEWKPEEFLKQKENVFKENKRIELYADSGDIQEMPVKTTKIDYIEPGDSFRVFKGNGEGFFVVSSSGKSGWIANMSIDKTKLTAKGFNYKETKEYIYNPNSKITNKITGRPLEYDILPDDYNSVNLENGSFDNSLQVLNYYMNADKYFKQYGKETNFSEFIREMKPLLPFENINKIQYVFERKTLYNFFGMIAVIDIGVPLEYNKLLYDYKKENKKDWDAQYDSLTWDDYVKYVEYVEKKGKYQEIVKMTLYTRDVNLAKIKEFEFKGIFAFKRALEDSLNNTKTIVLNDKGDLIIKIGVGSNGILIDNLPPMIEGKNTYILYPDYAGTNFFNGRKYALKVENIELKIEKKQILESKLNITNVLNNYQSSVHTPMEFLNLNLDNLDIKEKLKFSDPNAKFLIDVRSKYIPNINAYLFGFFRLDKKGGGALIINNLGNIIKYFYDDNLTSGLNYINTRNNTIIFRYGKKLNNIFSVNFEKISGVNYEY